jgi:hypothetical protein
MVAISPQCSDDAHIIAKTKRAMPLWTSNIRQNIAMEIQRIGRAPNALRATLIPTWKGRVLPVVIRPATAFYASARRPPRIDLDVNGGTSHPATKRQIRTVDNAAVGGEGHHVDTWNLLLKTFERVERNGIFRWVGLPVDV